MALDALTLKCSLNSSNAGSMSGRAQCDYHRRQEQCWQPEGSTKWLEYEQFVLGDEMHCVYLWGSDKASVSSQI